MYNKDAKFTNPPKSGYEEIPNEEIDVTVDAEATIVVEEERK